MRPLKDPLARSDLGEFGKRIVALRLEAEISRHIVATGIHWKKIRQMEEGWLVPSLVDDLMAQANRGKGGT